MVSSDLDDILDALPAQDKHEMSRKSLRKSAATMGRIKKESAALVVSIIRAIE